MAKTTRRAKRVQPKPIEKQEVKPIEKKFLRFRKVDYEGHKMLLERVRKYYQAVLDRVHPIVKDFDIHKDLIPLLRNPDEFIRDYIMKDFDPKVGGVELDAEYVRERLKMPEAWDQVTQHIGLLFQFRNGAEVLKDLEFYYMKDRRLAINLDKLKEEYTDHTQDEPTAKRLEFTQKMCNLILEMREADLWPDDMFKGVTSNWTDGVEPNYQSILLQRDISDLRKEAQRMKGTAFLGSQRAFI